VSAKPVAFHVHIEIPQFSSPGVLLGDYPPPQKHEPCSTRPGLVVTVNPFNVVPQQCEIVMLQNRDELNKSSGHMPVCIIARLWLCRLYVSYLVNWRVLLYCIDILFSDKCTNQNLHCIDWYSASIFVLTSWVLFMFRIKYLCLVVMILTEVPSFMHLNESYKFPRPNR